jgi:spore coat polysaccharide biosynthesis protein SpsF
MLGEVLVATTTQPADDIIVQECRRLSVPVFRGDENDVLDRYYRAAEWTAADVVVRITSDCPLIEPEISGETVRRFLDQQPDYASNALERTYPRGLDTEVITMPTLIRTWQEARQPYQRSHVTPYIYENPSRFKILSVTGDTDYSSHRWTLDTPDDLVFLRAVYRRMDNDDRFHWREILALLDREPTLMDFNRKVTQKALHEG